MSRGFVQGDHAFNWVLGAHLLRALAIIPGRLAQLVCPPSGATPPAIHRWNGRVYVVMASALALCGLSLVWIRGGAVGDLPQHQGTSLNAILILWFVVMAWQGARNRAFDQHRRWALRLCQGRGGLLQKSRIGTGNEINLINLVPEI